MNFTVLETMQERWTLTGKKALVTGATKGIGLAIAQEFLALGAEVMIVARNSKSLQQQLEEWKELGLPVHGIAADCATSAGRQAIFNQIVQAMGGLDLLINNAGTNIRKPAIDYTPEEYETIFQTNLISVFEMCRLVYPLLKTSDRSSIVNIGSVAGLVAIRTGAPYGMTKAALVQLTRALAVEWASDRIQVNTIAPWFIRTPLTEPFLGNPETLDAAIAQTPMKRIGDPQEIAGLAAFLCTSAASYITGQCIAVDGGFSAFGF